MGSAQEIEWQKSQTAGDNSFQHLQIVRNNEQYNLKGMIELWKTHAHEPWSWCSHDSDDARAYTRGEEMEAAKLIEEAEGIMKKVMNDEATFDDVYMLGDILEASKHLYKHYAEGPKKNIGIVWDMLSEWVYTTINI